MEKVYPIAHFECTEKLTNLAEYFISYSEMCNFITEDDVYVEEDLVLRKLRNLVQDTKPQLLENIPNICSVNALSVPGEIEPMDVFQYNKYTMKLHRDFAIPEEAKKLETIKAKMQFNVVEPRKKELNNVVLKPTKTARCNLAFSNILVFVRIYQPYSGVIDRNLMRKGDKLKCSHEIVALGSNLLSDLRDKILCANDNGYTLEINDLKEKSARDVKEEYPSGLIGINDVLYDDMRNLNAIRYSEVIKQWGIKKNIADFKVSNMEEVQIMDLNFRLGYPYIYQHRGNCEHILVFSDVRLIKRSDPLCYLDYPFYRNINRYNSEKCNICHTGTAKWLCCECDRLPHDRTFLCQNCFISYNYIDGKAVGTFKAYPYNNKSLVI